jgi:hypothetical protein
MTLAKPYTKNSLNTKNPMTIQYFTIKALYDNGSAVVTISGKNLGDAFDKFFKHEVKAFRIVTGFELMK